VRGSQCDNCRTFAVDPTTGWLTVTVSAERSAASLIFGASAPEVLGTFCSARCVAEFFYVTAEVK
jgi:hypothetical protein